MKLVEKVILVLITVAVAVTMSFLVVIPNGTVKAQDSTFTVNSAGDAIDQSHPAQIAYSGDDIVVTMSLASVSDQLTFNQSHVEDNRLEYSWGVRIDTDGNVSTGDGAGYDVEISLTHFKPPGNSPFTGTILDGTQKNTWVLSGSRAVSAHNIEAEIDHDTKSIIMIAKQSWEEFADFDINDRFCCKTYYYSPSGSVQDITSDNPPGSNIVSDPEGDVSYSFVDITGGKVQLPDIIQPSVSLTNHLISHTADYSVTFTISEDVAEGEDIIVEFPTDTDISGITDTDTDSDVTVAATSGIGSDAFTATQAGSATVGQQLTITVPDVNAEDKIGAGATVQVVVSGVVNPSAPGDYTLAVSTTNEDAVESAAYTITPPTIPPVPGIVEVYNPAGILMAQFTGATAIADAIAAAGEGYTIKVGPGHYTENVDVNKGLTIQSQNGADSPIVQAANPNDHVFTITADNVTIRGLDIYGATDAGRCGIMLITVSGCTIENNRCGWDDNHRNYVGIYLLNSNDSNSISGNTCNSNLYFGIYLQKSSNNTISGNTCNDNSVGGIGLIMSSENNTLSGNTCNSNLYFGIFLSSSSNSNTLSGNTCNSNLYFGIYLQKSSNNTISGNICNSNAYSGIYLYNSSNNTITSNTIAFNGGDGVVVAKPGTSNAILSNSIFSNAGLGIDLEPGGVTPNDVGDGDTGANNLQNFPVLTSATSGSTTVEGTFNSTPNTQFRLEFFSNSACDPSGHGEGEVFLGSTDVMTDGSGNESFTVTFPDTVTAGHFITATATDPDGNTSEFSACLQVTTAVVEAAVDFDPDTLNLKSKGKVVTVYIELPEGYDVEKTDVSTVMLNGIVPALAHPTDVGDYDSDGVPDLMVKFDRSDVQDVLEPGNEVEVTISGQLTDGTSFEGADTIRVIEKEKK